MLNILYPWHMTAYMRKNENKNKILSCDMNSFLNMIYDTNRIQMNLQELADTRTTLERDAERIRLLLHAPS